MLEVIIGKVCYLPKRHGSYIKKIFTVHHDLKKLV